MSSLKSPVRYCSSFLRNAEKANRQLNETTILKQQLENQIALLKEQIHSARMNDEHFDQRASVIDSEMDVREGQMKELQTEKDSVFLPS